MYMYKEIKDQLSTAFCLLVFLTIITGLLYPLTITALAQLIFPNKANGSIIEKNGIKIGSTLIGQNFSSPKYFWGRKSVTIPFPYNGEASLASNSGPSNSTFLATIKERVDEIKGNDLLNSQLIPVDLVTASGSGLDPEISPYAAFYQVKRVSDARNISEEKLRDLINLNIIERSWYLFGEPRINVLQLNLALDNL